MEKKEQQTWPDRRGNKNPMWGRHHSAATKQKQSEAARKRAEEYRRYKASAEQQHHVTMAEFLSNNPSVREYLNLLVKQQINEVVWRKERNL